MQSPSFYLDWTEGSCCTLLARSDEESTIAFGESKTIPMKTEVTVLGRVRDATWT